MRQVTIFAWSVVLAILSVSRPSTSLAENERIETIDELWRGFDPHAVPLDIEVIKSWDEAEIHLEMIYFTGDVFDGEPTRVFGYLGRPRVSAGKLPGILHIHGGGQTANSDWARFWARRGYVCLSFDFCGDTNFPELGPSYRREHFTKWGRVPANMMKVGGGLSMSPSPRHNPWFHWALAARRGLTVLEAQADVQAEQLGVFGISVGGTLTWTVAGTDPRVKAAVPIYGCGWEFYSYPPQLDAPMTEELRLWRTLIAPEAHASRITCPLLYLSASNDGHGRMDLSFWTLDRLSSPIVRQAFSANYDHHIEPEEGRSLPLWMDCHLKGTTPAWPAPPTIEVLGGGVPTIKVVPANADDLQQIDLYYCLNHDWPTTRFWRSAHSVRREGSAFIGEAPCLSTDDVITAFASVTESTGGRHSSRLLTQSLTKLDGVRPTLQRESLVDSMETSAAWHWVPAYTDPVHDSRFFELWEGSTGERGFTLDRRTFPRERPASFCFGTRKIGDPQFQAQGKAALLIDVFGPQIPSKLTIRLNVRPPGTVGQEFTSDLALPTAAIEWHTLRLSPDDLHNAEGQELPNWEYVEVFILQGESPAGHSPVFRNLRWE